MRYSRLSLILCACGVLLQAQSPVLPSAAPVPGAVLAVPTVAPALVVLEPPLDLGEVRTSEKRTFFFTLHNTGKVPVKLNSIRPACGCTTVRPTKMVLEPGEKMAIDGAFAGKGFSGHVEKHIDVLSDDPGRKQFSWAFTADVVPLAVPEHGQIFLEPKVGAAGETHYLLRLRARPDKPLKVSSINVTGNGPILLSNTYVQNGLEIEGTVAYDPKKQAQDAPGEALGGTARFFLGVSFEGGETEEVPFLFRQVPPYSLTPKQLALDSVAGNAMWGRATVTFDEAMEVVGTSSSHKAIQSIVSPIAASGGKAVSVDVSVEAGIPPGFLREQVVLKTNNSKTPTITVPVFILVRPSSQQSQQTPVMGPLQGKPEAKPQVRPQANPNPSPKP